MSGDHLPLSTANAFHFVLLAFFPFFPSAAITACTVTRPSQARAKTTMTWCASQLLCWLLLTACAGIVCLADTWDNPIMQSTVFHRHGDR